MAVKEDFAFCVITLYTCVLGAVSSNETTLTDIHANAFSPSSDKQGHNSSGHHGGLHVAAIAYSEVRDPLIFTIVVLLAGISKIGYHHADFLSTRIPESCILIILGTIFGAVFHFSDLSKSLPKFFQPHEFFIFLLPPIILEAAYSLHDRTFTENLGSILIFAVLGTILACVMLGGTLYGLAKAGAMGSNSDFSFMELMVFSSLIVAVDPVAVLAVFNEVGVNHVLYFLVFGESLLNDGVTVVLYKVFQAYNVMDEITEVQVVLGFVKFFVVCLGGLLLGVVAGIISAILTKYATKVKVAQPIIIFTMAYLGFLMAELFEFSGIISIIGCGLMQIRYAFHNISDKSRTTIKYFTKVISSANEIIIFMFLGLSLVNDDHEWHTGFTLWTILFCLVFRFIIIFGITTIINWLDVHRVRRIGLHEQFMIAYGGLRGAVCFSLVFLLNPNDFPSKNVFVTTTLAVIVFTVFVQGISIKPLVHLLQISLAPEKCQSMYKELTDHMTDHLMAGIEDIIGDHGKNHLREKLNYLDSKYLKPLLLVVPDPKDSRLMMFYENLLLKEHYKHLKLSGAKTLAEIPKMPHVNTEMLLSTLADSSTPYQLDNIPLLDKEPLELPAPPEPFRPLAMSAPATPAITIEMDNDVVLRRGNKMRRSISEGPGANISVRVLRHLLVSQRNSRLALSRYDKNLTSPEGIQSEIRTKSNKNRRLERLVKTPARVPQRRKSWSEADAKVCEERLNQAVKKVPRHAKTVDFGNADPADLLSGQDESYSIGSPGSLGSPLGSVFEEEEDAWQPMLDKKTIKPKKDSVKSNKFKLERQLGVDRSATGVYSSSLPERVTETEDLDSIDFSKGDHIQTSEL